MRLDRELLVGACDIHVHCAPSLFLRHDAVEIARNARDMGLRAIVLKDHHIPTVDRALYVSRMVPGIDVFGSVTLNYAVGGLNGFAVHSAIQFGAKVVWFPTVDTEQQKRCYGRLGGYGSYQNPSSMPGFYDEVPGISVLDQGGALLPDVTRILTLIADADVILCMGHLSYDELEAVVKEALRCGVKKVVIDHPHSDELRLSVEKQKKLVNLGAKMNYVFGEISSKWSHISVPEFVKHVREVGPENIVLSSDCGQLHNPLPAESLRVLVQMFLEEGVHPEDIHRMLVANSSALLYGGK